MRLPPPFVGLPLAALLGAGLGLWLGTRGAPPDTVAPPPAPPPAISADEGPGGALVPRMPGSPPPAVAAALRPELVEAFAPLATVASRRDREAAMERVAELVDEWRTETGEEPLRSHAWWKAALRMTGPTDPAPATGVVPDRIVFLGEDLPVSFWIPKGYDPEGPPRPLLLVVLEFSMDARRSFELHYGDLLDDHLIVAFHLRHPRFHDEDPLIEDDRIVMLGLAEAAAILRVDRDRVFLDGHGRGAGLVAGLVPHAAKQVAGAILRLPDRTGVPAANHGLVPTLLLTQPEPKAVYADVLGTLEEEVGERLRVVRSDDHLTSFTTEATTVAEWVVSMPPRRVAAASPAYAWETITGDRYQSWGHWFLVTRYTGFGTDRPIRVMYARDAERNAVVLETENVAEIRLLLNDDGLDLDRPVTVIHNGTVVGEYAVERSLDTLRQWANQDPSLIVTAELELRLP